MIDYNLAKELKDAGFPQHGLGMLKNENGLSPALAHGFPLEGAYGDFVYYPTISELIDACTRLLNYTYGSFELRDESYVTDVELVESWSAKLNTGIDKFETNKEDTKEEAVAKLWLTLNKK